MALALKELLLCCAVSCFIVAGSGGCTPLAQGGSASHSAAHFCRVEETIYLHRSGSCFLGQ